MIDKTNGRDTDVTQAHGSEDRIAVSRRRFVKRAMATAPLLATLPSGAALARSSNVISSTTAAGALDGSGRILCLNVRSGDGLVAPGVVDLGQPPSGRAVAITDRVYRVDDENGAATVSEAQMCTKGGQYYYKAAGWKKVTVPKGIMVSATALSSFTGSIYVTEI